MRLKYFTFVSVIVATCALFLAPSAWANSQRYEEDEKDGASSVMAGMYAAAGDIVTIDEPTDRDVYLAGSQVLINAPIQGDVFAGGSIVTVSNIIDGSVRAAGNTITIDGVVNGNVLLFANSVHITSDAVITGYANIYAATVVVDGVIEREAHIGAASVQVAGALRHATIEADTVEFTSTAVLSDAVLNRIQVKSPSKPVVAAGVIGSEALDYTFVQYEDDEDEDGAAFAVAYMLWKLFSFFALLLIALVIALIAPRWLEKVSGGMMKQFGKTVLYGVIVSLAVPMALLVVAFTLVGLPLALLAGMAYVILLMLGKFVVAAMLGRLILRANHSPVHPGKLVAATLLGFVILFILISIPIFGILVKLIVCALGIGAITLWIVNLRKI